MHQYRDKSASSAPVPGEWQPCRPQSLTEVKPAIPGEVDTLRATAGAAIHGHGKIVVDIEVHCPPERQVPDTTQIHVNVDEAGHVTPNGKVADWRACNTVVDAAWLVAGVKDGHSLMTVR